MFEVQIKVLNSKEDTLIFTRVTVTRIYCDKTRLVLIMNGREDIYNLSEVEWFTIRATA